MAWTSPMTAVDGEIFTASQFNTHVRDNLNETATAKANNVGGYFVTTGTNDIEEREFSSDSVATGESTTSTSFTDLATSGPAVTVTTGTKALVMLKVQGENTNSNVKNIMGYEISGQSSVSANDANSICTNNTQPYRIGAAFMETGLSAGSNTFTAKYKTDGGTATFTDRQIIVMPL